MGITLLGTLAILAGVALLLVALTNLLAFFALMGARIPPIVTPGAFLANAIVGFILGLFFLLRGRGFLQLRPWAWWVTVLPILVGIILAFSALLSGAPGTSPGTLVPGLPGLLILLVLFGYFLSVKKYFRKEREAASG